MIATSARRSLAALGLAVAVAGVAGTPASARITVDPARAESGGYTTLAFSVPTERPDVRTTKVEIRFPADHPMPGLTTEPKAGWDVTVEKIRSATASPAPAGDGADAANDRTTDPVSSVTWTASTSDAAIAPGRFELFRVSVGPLPFVDVLVFEAVQTYSDGDVVSWDGRPAEGSEDAASTPAPVLALTASASGEEGGSPAPAATASPGASAASAASPQPSPEETVLETERVSAALVDDDDRSARVALGFATGAVLILGAVAATAFARRRDGVSTGSAGP